MCVCSNHVPADEGRRRRGVSDQNLNNGLPFASPGHYLEDAAHIKDYVAAATPLIKDGSRAALDAYLDRYVREPKSHAEYLTRIGFERILSLHEY